MTPELVIEPYKESDAPRVLALWAEVFPNPSAWNDPAAEIARKLRVQRELFLVARLDGDLAGTAMAGFDGHRGWVHYVAVSPQQRRHGVGRALLEQAERRLRAAGCAKINLQVRAGNEGVVPFYQALGYEVEERISMGKRL
jgi:ribosomal protein S18 acetylase RimI-like enzyme